MDYCESSRLVEQISGLDILSKDFETAIDGLSVSQRNAVWTALTRESKMLTKSISDMEEDVDRLRSEQHTLQMRRRRIDFIRGAVESRGLDE